MVKKTILITGGAGFIGSQLADRLLAGGYKVLVFDNLSWGKRQYFKHNLNNPDYQFVKLDLRHKSQVAQAMPPAIDTVFHLAANSDIARGSQDPNIDLEHSIEATFHVLMAMKEKGIKKIFFTSGSGVYGDVGTTYTGEDFGPLLPVSMYGATKLSAEAIIAAFVHLYGMQAWILRPANIIGPRSTHGVIYDFMHKLRKDPSHLQILGDGRQSKSYLHTDDVLDSFFLVWQKTNKPINLYNLASNDFITVNHIAKIIIKTMALKNVQIEHTGGKVGWIGDVPKVRLTFDALEKLGWKRKYTTMQAVERTASALLKEI